MNTLDSLLRAKELSDTAQYSPKARIMFDLMTRDPHDFQVDTTGEQGGHPGVTHTPTGFRMHVPWKYIPASVGSRKEDLDSQEDTGFTNGEREKPATLRHKLITGVPGSGKTTEGQRLSSATGMPLVSLDGVEGMTGAEDTAQATLDFLAQLDEPSIVEGVQIMGLDPEILRQHELHVLDPDEEVLVKRLVERGWEDPVGTMHQGAGKEDEARELVASFRQALQRVKNSEREKEASQQPPADPFVTHLDSERYFGRPGSVLSARDILEAANAHGVDPRLLASVVANESAWGTHPNAVASNNFSGIMGSGSELRQYNTPSEGLQAAARLLRNRYIDRGLTTPETIGPVYAPTEGATNDPGGMNNNWVSTVNSIMNRIPPPAQTPQPASTPQPTATPTPQPVNPEAPPYARDQDTMGNQTTPASQMGPPAQPTPTPGRMRFQIPEIDLQAPPGAPVKYVDPPPALDKSGSTEDTPWDEQEFQDYIQSHMDKRASPQPPVGSRQLLQALHDLNLDDLERQSRETVKSGPKSKRGEAIKRLNIIEGLRRNQVSPQDLMITRVPVLPAQFRPYSAQGTTFIPGDSNVLYKDLMNMRRAYDEEQAVFGDEGAGSARASLYDAVKAVYGYGPPTNEKAKAKGVTGFLEKVTGTGPKTSYVSRRLLGKTQDQTARGTIIAAPDLGMDEVGVPREMAWSLFAPYVQRRLVRGGMSPGNALKAVKEKSREAERALEMEIPERPVVYSRSPAWHKWNTIAGRVKLTDGDGIGVNPFTLEGLSGDFDGDAMNIHLPATEEARVEALEKLLPSRMVIKTRDPDDIMSAPRHEQILGLFTANQRPSKNHWTFPSEAEALRAIQSGRVSLSDDVEITGAPLTPEVPPDTLPPLTEPQRNRV